jgi:hypothetical protein
LDGLNGHPGLRGTRAHQSLLSHFDAPDFRLSENLRETEVALNGFGQRCDIRIVDDLAPGLSSLANVFLCFLVHLDLHNSSPFKFQIDKAAIS